MPKCIELLPRDWIRYLCKQVVTNLIKGPVSVYFKIEQPILTPKMSKTPKLSLKKIVSLMSLPDNGGFNRQMRYI